MRLSIALVTLSICLLSPASVWANVIEPTTFADENSPNGNCTLREAVRAANLDVRVDGCLAGSGADEIKLDRGTYTLGVAGRGEDTSHTGDLDITSNLTITGDLGGTTVDGGGIDRVFDVRSGDAAFRILTIRGGDAGADRGGGIAAEGGTTTVFRSAVSGEASGGDGIAGDGGAVDIEASTVGPHVSGGDGVEARSSAVKLTMSTVLGAREGGALVSLKGTIVVGCAGTLTSRGYNYFDLRGTTCDLEDRLPTDIWDGFIDFSRSGDNGGPTGTVGISAVAGDGAVDAGPPASDPDCGGQIDQRGIPRPQFARCDIGAFEDADVDYGCDVGRFIFLGTEQDDIRDGTEESDFFLLGDGADRSNGLGGRDCVNGESGNDLLRGAKGKDFLSGGAGQNRLLGGTGHDQLFGDNGRGRLVGGKGDDYLLDGYLETEHLLEVPVGGPSVLVGGKGDDNMWGGDYGDLFRGGRGKDYLRASFDRDRIFGGPGRDRINSGGGNDLVVGGRGKDHITCGPGRDKVLHAKGDDVADSCEVTR